MLARMPDARAWLVAHLATWGTLSREAVFLAGRRAGLSSEAVHAASDGVVEVWQDGGWFWRLRKGEPGRGRKRKIPDWW